jgi:hypothetical protein
MKVGVLEWGGGLGGVTGRRHDCRGVILVQAKAAKT